MTDTSKPQWPWPFPCWDGSKFVMPVEFMSAKDRKAWTKNPKKTQKNSIPENFPEALV